MDPWQVTPANGKTDIPSNLDLKLNFEDEFAPVEDTSYCVLNYDSTPIHDTSDVSDDQVAANTTLPDSKEYLARLERKLLKLKNGSNSSKSLVESLSARKDVCMTQLLTDSESLSQDFDENVQQNRTQELLLRFIAPHKQGLTIEELVRLLSADQLSLSQEKEKNDAES